MLATCAESRAEPEVADDFCFDSHCGEYLDCVGAQPKACLSSCALKHTEHRSSQECTFMAETELRTDELENSAKRANGTDSETGGLDVNHVLVGFCNSVLFSEKVLCIKLTMQGLC